MSAATRHRDAVINNLERGQIRKTRSTDFSKREKRDFEFFTRGAAFGARMRMQQVQNSVAGLDYGASYFVPPTVEPVAGTGPSLVDGSGDSGSSSSDAGAGDSRESSDLLGRPSESDSLPA